MMEIQQQIESLPPAGILNDPLNEREFIFLDKSYQILQQVLIS